MGAKWHTVSKEMRVRMDGLVKIMAMVFPASGLKLSSPSLKLFFTCMPRTFTDQAGRLVQAERHRHAGHQHASLRRQVR